MFTLLGQQIDSAAEPPPPKLPILLLVTQTVPPANVSALVYPSLDWFSLEAFWTNFVQCWFPSRFAVDSTFYSLFLHLAQYYVSTWFCLMYSEKSLVVSTKIWLDQSNKFISFWYEILFDLTESSDIFKKF